MPLTTTSQLLTRLKQEVRDESSTTDTETRLLARLNDAYLEIVSGGGLLNDGMRGAQSSKPYVFSWALSTTPIVFNTEAPVTSLTSTVNKGSTALTLSTTYASSLAGWYLRLQGDSEVYRISAHTAGTGSVTLDQEYVNADTSAATTTIFKLDYTVGSDILIPTNGLVSYDYDVPVPIVDVRASDNIGVKLNAGKGFPTRAYLVKQDAVNKSVTLRLDNYTEEPERLELPYVPYPTALDTSSNNPILPAHHNLILVEYAASMEYDLRDSDSAKLYMARALQRFKAMQAEDRQFSNYQDSNYGKVIGWSRNPEYLKGRRRSGGHPRNNRGNN